MIDPEISCTFESTKTDPKEAVKVIWVTGEDDRASRKILVGHSGGTAALTMEQWDSWCDRVGAQMWERDAASMKEHGHPCFDDYT